MTLPQLVLLLVGALIGVIYAFVSWRSIPDGAPLRTDPRIKNLLYAFGALALALVSRLLDANANIGSDAILYFLGFLGGVAATLGAVALRIGLKYRLVDKHGFHPVIDYFTYGYDAAAATLAEAGVGPPQLTGAGGKALAVAIANAYALLRAHEPSDGWRRQQIEDVLTQIEAVAAEFTPDVTAVTYMTLAPFDPATPGLRFSAAASSPRHLLLLEGSTRTGAQPFALPLADDLTHALPGAPEAYLQGKEVFVAQASLSFRPNVPDGIQTQIRDFLKQADFQSFASMPLIGAGDPGDWPGIVNIESTEEPFLANDTVRQLELANRLLPLRHLLGILIHERSRCK